MKPIATQVISRIPVFHTVRVIYTPGVYVSEYGDGLLEFNIDDIQNDPHLVLIKRKLEYVYGEFE